MLFLLDAFEEIFGILIVPNVLIKNRKSKNILSFL